MFVNDLYMVYNYDVEAFTERGCVYFQSDVYDKFFFFNP